MTLPFEDSFSSSTLFYQATARYAMISCCHKSLIFYDHHSILSFFSRLYAPAVIRLIHHAGDKGNDVLCAVAQDTGIVHADFTDRIYLIAACAELGSQLDGVANVKGVNFAKVIVDAAIVVE